MKRLRLVLLFAVLLLAPSTWAGPEIFFQAVVKTSAGLVGDTGTETGDLGLSAGWGIAYRVQATATGSLANGYLYHSDTNNASAMVAIYSSSASTPQSGDALVGVSGEIVGGTTTGWKSSAMSGGTVTSGNWYWVIICVSATSSNNWGSKNNTTHPVFLNTGAGFYEMTPSTLGATAASFNQSDGYGPISAYAGS